MIKQYLDKYVEANNIKKNPLPNEVMVCEVDFDLPDGYGVAQDISFKVVHFVGYTIRDIGDGVEQKVPVVHIATSVDVADSIQSLGVIESNLDGQDSALQGGLVYVRTYGPLYDALLLLSGGDGTPPPSTPQEQLNTLTGQTIYLDADGEIVFGINNLNNIRAIGTILYVKETPVDSGNYSISFFFDGGQTPESLQTNLLALQVVDELPQHSIGAPPGGICHYDDNLYFTDDSWATSYTLAQLVAGLNSTSRYATPTLTSIADVGASSATTATPLWSAPSASSVIGAAFYCDVGVSEDDTNYATFLFKVVRDSSDVATGSLTTKTIISGGIGSIPFHGGRYHAFSSPISMIAGDTLVFSITKSGTGVALPARLMTVKIAY